MPSTDQLPAHPIAQMTSSELAAYRRNLETGLGLITKDGPTRDVLQARLAEVAAEEDDRDRIRRANGSA